MKFETILQLFENDLEGDARVMSHETHGDTKGPGNIIVRGNSTDMFIILLENVQTFLKSHLWLDIRFDYGNSHNYADMSKNLIMQKTFQESTHIIYLYFTEKGKSGPCY